MDKIINKKILLTGGTGFIGGHILSSLCDDNVLYCLARKSIKIKNKNNLFWINQDLQYPIDSSKLPSDIDMILHIAAEIDTTTSIINQYIINTMSTLRLLEYGKTKNIDTFLYASTGGIYEAFEEPVNDKEHPSFSGFYNLTKYESELLVNYYSKYFNTIILRYFFPYGTGQRSKRLISSIIRKIKEGEEIIINSNGKPEINPIYISDLIEATFRSILLIKNMTLDIAGPEKMNILTLSNKIAEILSREPKFKYIDGPNVGKLLGDNSLMKELISFAPQVSINDGLRMTIENLDKNLEQDIIFQ